MVLIETERLLISPLNTAHASFILEIMNSPGWLAFIGDRGIRSIDDAERYIVDGPMASYEKNGFGLYQVALKQNDLSIGICGILKRDTLEHPDIGFALLPAYTGKGYALESAKAMMEYACTTLQLKKVAAITKEKNLRSVQLLQKLGLLFEKKIKLAGNEEELMLFGTA